MTRRERIKIWGPPGTGKTSRLIGIVNNELDHGVRPEEIIYTSFTRAACKEAIQRALMTSEMDYKKVDFPWFRTEHAICYKLLGLKKEDVFAGKQQGEFIDRYPAYKVSATHSESFENREAMTDPKTLGDYYEFFISWMDNMMMPFEDAIRQFLKNQRGEQPDGFTPAGARIYMERRDAFKQENSLWDFSDMIHTATQRRLCPEAKVLIADECFPYDTSVRMADGTIIPIGDIVENKTRGFVSAFNIKTRKIERKRIIGWHKLPWRDCIQVNNLPCTPNHPIFTQELGYLPAHLCLDLDDIHVLRVLSKSGEKEKDNSKSLASTSVGRYVYCIDVEDNHNFFANDILVHNCQDAGKNLYKLIEMWASQVERVYIAGDKFQSIYLWAGSDPELFDEFQAELQVLPHSHRLPPQIKDYAERIIALANLPFPQFSAADKVGEIKHNGHLNTIDWLNQGPTFLLARTNWQLKGMSEQLKLMGVPYTSERLSSPLDGSKGEAYRTLIKLQARERVNTDELRALAKHTREPWLVHGAKTRIKDLVQAEYAFKEIAHFFSQNFLDVIAEDFSAVLCKDIDVGDKTYLHRVYKKCGVAAFMKKPEIVLTTIHGSKGREKETVVISQELGKKVFDAYLRDKKSEVFVAYVAVTRSMKKIIMLQRETPESFPYPRMKGA